MESWITVNTADDGCQVTFDALRVLFVRAKKEGGTKIGVEPRNGGLIVEEVRQEFKEIMALISNAISLSRQARLRQVAEMVDAEEIE